MMNGASRGYGSIFPTPSSGTTSSSPVPSWERDIGLTVFGRIVESLLGYPEDGNLEVLRGLTFINADFNLDVSFGK